MIPVTLTAEEIEFAAISGALRRARALIRGLQDRYGAVDVDPWSIDIEGVGGEMAAARVLDRYYVPALRVQANGGDVSDYEVRSTHHEGGCLMIKDGDADDRYFILVVGRIPRLRVIGWIQARAGKRTEWRRTVRNRSAWFVPQSALQPFEKKIA